MKQSPLIAALSLSALLLAPAAALAQAGATAPGEAASGAKGILEIEELTYDAGTVDRGTNVRHSFKLKNVGKAPLNIQAKPG